MGASYWSDDFYRDREEVRAKENKPVFAHDAAIRSGTAKQEVHAKLNPHGVKVRESRDSKEHPESLAIAVMFDITGSMESVPRKLQSKLPNLMNLLITKGYVKDPQILFGAVGDTTTDPGSLQIGQFESGIEMDDDLGRMWLVGMGGGQVQESYQNAIYFFARHTSIDCFEKRNKKGYLFLIGDENPYSAVSRREIATLCGDTLEADIPTEQIIKEAQEKYHVFYLIPTHTTHGRDPQIRRRWESLLGKSNVLMLENEDNICELIGLTVGLCEGTAEIETVRKDLQTAGVKPDAINTLAGTLAPLAVNKARPTNSKNVRL